VRISITSRPPQRARKLNEAEKLLSFRLNVDANSGPK
jgi:hypothetical protein